MVFEGGGEGDQLQTKYVDGFFILAGIGIELDQHRTAIGGWGYSLFVAGNNGCVLKHSQEDVSVRF